MSQFIIGVTAGDLPPSVPTSFDGNTGTAIAVGNVLNVIGTGGTTVTASGNTLSVTATGTNIDLVGDVGTAVGPIITQTAKTTAGSSVTFQNSGSTSKLNTTDLNGNTIIGNPAGNLSITGVYNIALGNNIFTALTTGSFNTCIGAFEESALSTGSSNTSIGYHSSYQLTTGTNNLAGGVTSLSRLITGSYNIAFGSLSGSNYQSSESSNICIGNLGVISESNVMRLGTTGTGNGQVSTAYIAGVAGVTVSNQVFMTMNSSTGQAGTVASVPVANGGTGATTFTTTNGIVTYNGTSLVTAAGGTINSSGYYNNTKQPCFFAYVAGSSQTGVTGNGTVYTVIFDTKSFDQSTSYSTVTGYFTAPVTGRYQFNVSITMNGLLVGNNLGEIILDTSAGTWKLSTANYGLMFETSSGQMILGISGSIIIPLAATNVALVQLAVYGNASANIGIVGGSGQGTYFSGVLLD